MTRPAATVLVAAGLYLAVLLAIGLWAARRTRTAGDFFVAGRRLGPFVTALAMMSSAFSGFVFLGGPGLTYAIGVASWMIVLPLGITGAMLCWVVGRPLCRLAAEREIYTVPDVVQARFECRLATGLAALAVLAGSVAYLALQLRTLGVLVGFVFSIESRATVVGIGLAILVGYTVAGGMVAGAYTDVVQGGLMLAASAAVFFLAVGAAGGWTEMASSIAGSAAFGRPHLEPLGVAAPLTAFGFFLVFGTGVLGQPQMVHKFLMLREERELRSLPLVLGASQAIGVLIWIGLGLGAVALVAQGRLAPLDDRPDAAAAAFLVGHVPAWLAGVVFAGVLAAIMSTADSFLSIGSAALVRDLPRVLGRPFRDELAAGRVAVVLVAAAAGAMALSYGDLIARLGTFAFGILAAPLAPVLAVGLNWSGVTRQAAVASIATGLVATAVFELWPRALLADGALPAGAALAASFTALFVVQARPLSARSRRSPRSGSA